MAKALRTIAVVAGAVALVASAVGTFGASLGISAGLLGTIATVGTIAGVVAGVAGIGARLLTKPPPARGSVTETIIDIDPPSPYGMGEGYFGGVMRHRVGYGPTLKKVPNPFLFEVIALSVAGPIAGPITPLVDFGAVTSYYSGWLATDTRLGARPDTALTAPLQANPPGWSTSHKLSGTAAIAWNHKFDKDGKIYASGLPTRGVVAKWVLVYDPRKDSTRPGGSGAHRLGDETTYEWSENPALPEKDRAAAVLAGLLLKRSANAPGFKVPLHDALAEELGLDAEQARRAWTPDHHFTGLFPKLKRMEFAQPHVPADAFRSWKTLADTPLSAASAHVLAAQPSWVHTVISFDFEGFALPADAREREPAE